MIITEIVTDLDAFLVDKFASKTLRQLSICDLANCTWNWFHKVSDLYMETLLTCDSS